MTLKGFQRALRSFARRSPFLPFQIELVSGSLIRVTHPEAVRIRENVVIHVAPNGRQRLFDFTSVCQLSDEDPHDIPNLDQE